MKPVRQIVKDGVRVTVAGGVVRHALGVGVLLGRRDFPRSVTLCDGDTFTFAYELTASGCRFCGTPLELDAYGICVHCGGPPKGWDPRDACKSAGVLVWDGTRAELAKVKEQWQQASRPPPKPLTEMSFTVR